MTLAAVYEPSPVKRYRSTKAVVSARRAELHRIVGLGRPMTVRQAYYQATVRGLIEKTEAGYKQIQTDLVYMRKAGEMPYEWLADSTRWQRRPSTFNSIEHALENTARLYRKALWNDIDAYVEIWLEKDALAGVLYPVTSKYDVSLMVSRGYASLSFTHSAAAYINTLDVPVYIYHLGDFDPSGVDAANKVERDLREFAPEADITFERLAVTQQQITEWSLPTRPTKKSDTRSKKFGDISVELDAIPPTRLRALVERRLERHLPQDELRVLQTAELSERRLIRGLVGMALDKNGGAA